MAYVHTRTRAGTTKALSLVREVVGYFLPDTQKRSVSRGVHKYDRSFDRFQREADETLTSADFAGRKFSQFDEDEDLQFEPVGIKMRPAGTAEADSGTDLPAEEQPATSHQDGERREQNTGRFFFGLSLKRTIDHRCARKFLAISICHIWLAEERVHLAAVRAKELGQSCGAPLEPITSHADISGNGVAQQPVQDRHDNDVVLFAHTIFRSLDSVR